VPDLDWQRDGPTWPHHDISRFVQAAGLRWHVQEMGALDAPPILLLHGTGAASASWRGVMPLLAEHCRVVAIDLPGHGFTQAPEPRRLSLQGMAADIAQLLRTLDISPRVVVGHSAGAAILARMCLDRRIAPQRLVSLCGAFLPFEGVAGHVFSPLAKLLSINPVVPRLFAWQAGSAGAVERLLRDTGSTLDAQGVAIYRRLVRSPAHVAAALRMMANWQLEPLVRDLPNLKMPLLLVAADNDRTIAPRAAHRVHALVPGSTVVSLPQLGHLAHEERPSLVADLIVKSARETV
jgi:magnesium chelatase accessory protein